MKRGKGVARVEKESEDFFKSLCPLVPTVKSTFGFRLEGVTCLEERRAVW